MGDRAFYRHYLLLAVPMILQNAITNLVSFLDNIMVGQLGTEQMSGVAIVNQLIFVYNLAIFGAVSAASIFGAQYFGNGDHRGHMHSFRFKLYATLLVSGLTMLLLLTKGSDLISLYLTDTAGNGATDVALQYGKQYLVIMLVGLVPFAVNQAYATNIKETGQTLVPMLASFVAVGTNAVLDYLLIFGVGPFPELGVAMARIGTAVALAVSLPVARWMGDVSYPVLFGAILLCVGFASYMIYCVMDRKEDASAAAVRMENGEAEEEGFKLSDLKLIFCSKGFWLINLLCLMFYAGVFPFLKFATKLMIYKYDVPESFAGLIPALLPFGTILLTPVFGSLYDRIGRGATLMIIGSVMLTVVHVLFALPVMNYWWFAVIVMIVLGIAFSLVPSAMWPSVPKIIPMKQLGSAYATIFYIQNIGLTMVPWLIGWVIEHFATLRNEAGVIVGYDYTAPMVIFAVFGLCAILISTLLRVEDSKKHYGLEEANMKK